MNNLLNHIQSLENRIKDLEGRLGETGYEAKRIVTSEFKKTFKLQPQAETYFGMHTALCVDTIDPWKQNRVRFFSPFFHDPNSDIQSLPFADPISAMGGFDDCGLTWVPPAGSTLCLVFEHGNRDVPYYLGTTWHRDRGPDGQHNWNFPIDEFYKIHESHRLGYMVGANDGSQVFPPWNTDNYNGYDIDSIIDFEQDTEAQQKITYAHKYGFKTPQKHQLMMDDGNYKCNQRWSQVQLKSGGGSCLLFWDDPNHPAAQCVNPLCNCASGGGDASLCNDEDGNPLEQISCRSTPDQTECANPYQKHQSECRPFAGPGTPQNNRCELKQTGAFLTSPSGHVFVMDDAVAQPQGIPNWERGISDFDFGCNNTFKGKTYWVSATGHRIEMSDDEVENSSGVRSQNNYIRILSANGNKIELNDHTVGDTCTGCPPNIAGSSRGILIQSTSNNIIQLSDEENEQCAPCRMDGGVPVNKAKKAFIKIRTGYGIEIDMNDANSQQETQQQYFQIFSPQKDNDTRGPHIFRMQETAEGPGQVFLRAGGDYVCYTYDDHLTVVGDEDQNPADKMTIVTRDFIEVTRGDYFHKAGTYALDVDDQILLMAGKNDCNTKDGCGPCVWPILVMSPSGVTISDRVFASASPNATCASIFQMLPFSGCPTYQGCGG